MALPRLRRVRLSSMREPERDASLSSWWPDLWAEARRFGFGGSIPASDAGVFMTRWCGPEVAHAWSELPERQRWMFVRIVAQEGVAQLRLGRKPLAVSWFGNDGLPGRSCFVVFRDGVPSPVCSEGQFDPDGF